MTDKSIRELGLTRDLERVLKEHQISCAIYDGTRPNPTTDMVMEGSPHLPGKPLRFHYRLRRRLPHGLRQGGGRLCGPSRKRTLPDGGLLKVARKIPTLIAVPTTAGTGSETTLAAVIVDSETRHKYVINDFALIPPYAVLDPAVTHSLPASVAAETGIDALTHAVEAYIGRSTTAKTRSDARRAVKLIFENLENACAHRSRRAEKNMLVAAPSGGPGLYPILCGIRPCRLPLLKRPLRPASRPHQRHPAAAGTGNVRSRGLRKTGGTGRVRRNRRRG